MKKALVTATAALLTAATLLLAGIWLRRLSLPYSEQGRYFDEANGVVYDESAITAYGMLTALFGLMTTMSLLLASRAWRK